MTNLGLPVPPGFTITTDACREYLHTGDFPAGAPEEVTRHLQALEKAMGRRLGQVDDPLLVSVRSGAKFSMPGMMETVLNIGLNDESVHGLAKQAGDERFAWDSYRRCCRCSARRCSASTVSTSRTRSMKPSAARAVAATSSSAPRICGHSWRRSRRSSVSTRA